jgi:hypothetical protein
MARALLLVLILACLTSTSVVADEKMDKEALIKDALSAAPPAIAKTATVMDGDGTVLKKGSGAYTCYPTLPPLRGKGHEPMCLDKVWMEWHHAWMERKDFKPKALGIAYMLAGDSGRSNIDPFAEKPTKDNQWVVEGPHVMVIVPDSALLDTLPTDPNNGGAYVMLKGTPYAHIMVPVAKRPPAMPKSPAATKK